MLLRRPARVLTTLVVAGLLATPSTGAFALAGGRPTMTAHEGAEEAPAGQENPAPVANGHELPFTCTTDWTGTTRRSHRPSVEAVDFNRPDDLGKLVLASAAGVVSRVADTGARGYGRWVEITHAEGFTSLYAHLKAPWVAVGQFVDQGTPVGRVGATGSVTGAHLHYEQRYGGEAVAAVFNGERLLHGTPTASLNCPDVPLAGDWDGDRADEVAVFRRDGRAGTFQMHTAVGAPAAVRLGRASDLPVTGDWDGDGVTDLGVRRQGRRLFLMRTTDGVITRKRFGRIRDLPVTGDWDGNGTTDVGVYRPGGKRFVLRMADGIRQAVRFGGPGAQPVTGDWDGDGVTDLGVFDTATATFHLRTVAADGYPAVTSIPFGASTDLPVVGDWDGDGTTDVGTWTPDTATYTLGVTRPDGAARYPSDTEPEIRMITFGRPR
jgi:hypothetical protein